MPATACGGQGVEYDKLTDDRLGEPSAVVRERVEAARAVHYARSGVDTEHETRNTAQQRRSMRVLYNADMGPAEWAHGGGAEY